MHAFFLFQSQTVGINNIPTVLLTALILGMIAIRIAEIINLLLPLTHIAHLGILMKNNIHLMKNINHNHRETVHRSIAIANTVVTHLETLVIDGTWTIVKIHPRILEIESNCWTVMEAGHLHHRAHLN